MSDEELAKHFQDKDDNTLRQMAWRHGYGKMSDYYVNRKNKGMSQDTNEGEMRMDKSAFVQMLANKIQEPQKGQGKPEYDNRLLAKMYKLITGRDVGFDGDKFTITMNKPTTEDADVDAQFKSDVLQFLNSKVVQIEKQIELQPANTAEEKENKEFALKLFNFVQAKLEQKDDATNTLTVPKSMIKKK